MSIGERGYPKCELSHRIALEVEILGERRKATVIAEPAHDPGNEHLRS